MGKRLLVVDDDAPIRNMVSAVLKQQSYEVDSCNDADEALLCLNRQHYDAMVLALVRRNPGADEKILLTLHERAEPLSVVLMSAGSAAILEGLNSDLIKARLRKPFEITELVSAVNACFHH